jgi:DNA-binding NarL/FixJ family response regulator
MFRSLPALRVEPMHTVTILLVDDHAVVRAGYKRYLELDAQLRVEAEAQNGEEAYAILAHVQIDVVVMDLSMPGQGGLESLRRIRARYPHPCILIFTMHDNPALATQALRAGASGYLTKSTSPDKIVEAIHQVMRGERPVSEEVARLMEKEASSRARHLDLAPREFEIFRLLASGLSVEDIGKRLFLGTKTIANYQSSIRQKLQVQTAIELYQYARTHGLG